MVKYFFIVSQDIYAAHMDNFFYDKNAHIFERSAIEVNERKKM